MSRMLLGLMVLGLLGAPVMAAITNPYSPDLATIQGMTKTWDGANSTSSNLTVTTVGGTVTFAANLQSGNGTGSGFATTGIGYPWPTKPPVNDLSAYDGYVVTFKNTNNSNWLVNLYMNTGWTDSPYSETDRFYQNGWTELAPGQSATLSLDFDSANLFIGGVDQGMAAVVNANHVTNFGFQVGGNMTNPWTTGDVNPSNPDNFHVTVSQTVPAPAALLLAGIGTGLVGWLRRRRSV